MEGGRRLRDRLAGAAGEFLAHRLDHLVAARHDLQRLGDALTEFGQLAATAGAHRRCYEYDPFAWQMRWQRRADWFYPSERAHRGGVGIVEPGGLGILAGGRLEFLELHLQLVEQLAAALGGGAEEIALHLGNQQLEMRHHCLRARGPSLIFEPCRALGGEFRTQRVDLGGQAVGGGAHGTYRITMIRSHALTICRSRRSI